MVGYDVCPGGCVFGAAYFSVSSTSSGGSNKYTTLLEVIYLFYECFSFIDNLYKLETAMRTNGYQLFVERESSSFGALEVYTYYEL